MLHHRLILGVALALAGASGAAPAQVYRDFTIGAGFTPDPLIGTGTTGGRRSASDYGVHCTGRIASRPDHTFRITSTVDLRLSTESSLDTTLVLVGPSGAFCDDDSHGGLGAEINAVLTPGAYEVYVGHFSDTPAQYTLTLTENPRITTDRDFEIGAGFLPDPQTARGDSGGSRDASIYGPECTGRIASNPDHVINVTSAVNLKLHTESTTDSTLVLTGPAGTFCDDDSHGGLDAEINAELTPGAYEVYVGNFRDTPAQYTLTLTENPRITTDRDFEIGAGFLPDPQTARGDSGGSRDASIYGPECTGRIASSPDHVINVTSAVNLKLHTESTTDSTLVLTGPAGTFCDDDSHGGLDAEINAELTPGAYEVYVGNFIDTPGQYTLTLTENPQGINDRDVLRGDTRVSRDAAIYGPGCTGRIASIPDHLINVTSTVNLKLYTESTTDSTLVLVGPSGSLCDDDSRGNMDAEINAVLTPGTYEVYVGNFGDTPGQYTLTLTENLGRGGPSAPTYSSFTIGAGFLPDPQTGSGTTGGSRDAAIYGPGCTGRIASSPDHVINVTSEVNLRLYTESTTDSTLVLVGPSGSLCDDDSRGNMDAEINARLAPGRYEVYIGDFTDPSGQYTLTLTENL